MAKDKLNLEQLSDSELNEYLRRIEDQRNAVPSEQQLAGGAPRELSLVMVIAGLLGIFASVSLIQA